jgi:hypothetical protein
MKHYKHIDSGELITLDTYNKLFSFEKEEYEEVIEQKKGLDSDFLVSAALGFATGSSLLGGLVGGDLFGGVVGDLMDGDLFD